MRSCWINWNLPDRRRNRRWNFRDCIRACDKTDDYHQGRLAFFQPPSQTRLRLADGTGSVPGELRDLARGNCGGEKFVRKNVDELHYRGRSLLPLGIVLSIRMGRPAVAITSPSSLKVTIKLPRYLPNANAWTTGTILPDDCFTKVGYGPCGSSIDGAGPVKES